MLIKLRIMNKDIDIEHVLNDLSKLDKIKVELTFNDVMNKVAKRKQELAPKGLLIGSIMALVIILGANVLLGCSKQNKSEKLSFAHAVAYDLGIESNHSIYGNL